MSAEQVSSSLPPQLELVNRAPNPGNFVDLRFQRMARSCPQLVIPLQAMREVKASNPNFSKRDEQAILAFSLWTENPSAIPQIAKVFQTSEQIIERWVDHVTTNLEDAWTTFEVARTHVEDTTPQPDAETKQKKFFRTSSELWQATKITDKFTFVLGPNLGKLVTISAQTNDFQEIAEKADLTYGSTRQRLYIGRKKLEERLPDMADYTKVGKSDIETQLAVRMGLIEGFAIGNVWYVSEASKSSYSNSQSHVIIEPSQLPSDLNYTMDKRKPKKRTSPSTTHRYKNNTIYDKS